MRNWKRDIVLFMTSQTLSLLGSALVQYALMWHVTLETKSGVYMMLYIICGFVPTFLLSPFAGVWADRHDRKKIIMLADLAIALVTLALAAVFAAGGRALWLFFLAAAIRALGGAMQGPAVGALLPQIVPVDQLTRVNGINGSIQSVIMLLSPALSGLLLTIAPIQAIFLIDVVTAALAIGVLGLFLEVPPHAKASAPQTTSYFHDMRLGFKYIREHRYLSAFFAYLAVLLFLVTPAAFLTPLQVARNFGAEVWHLSAIEIAFSGGMMLGGGLIALWGGFRNRMRTMAASNLVMAGCTVALGLIPSFWPYTACMVVFGIAMPFFNTPSAVMLQEHVEESYLGRVFSVLTMLSTSLMPLGMLVFGPLAELVRIEWLLLGTGGLMLALAAGATLNRRLMAIGLPPASAVSPGNPGMAEN
ncbi:MAG: MFS transporter [Spirochaetes bacterium GWD1_61_31]|nr:MAG: MFS transporter [Spirochaetes bacterium GWB1_60_80]OHD31641.1 MAG: MFS transporter [Spirochaetes bacterium GWC1_61_12]OHD42067.1 MAG: MFS transporter [Spirochaetes bacterium GWD1_61_31]OHD43396.1 MAG: MFS transporter [Spirochaetes bacterium GWE1_60_18]OHD58929.1 MAG: MFS transporter [Spirochaetes bacterium GWF1_60_12]HAP42983.1 MFS transporter [Spirochaetaceae bacterium]